MHIRVQTLQVFLSATKSFVSCTKVKGTQWIKIGATMFMSWGIGVND